MTGSPTNGSLPESPNISFNHWLTLKKTILDTIDVSSIDLNSASLFLKTTR